MRKKSYLKMTNFMICETYSVDYFHKTEAQDF